jgi:hypothetical protein
VRHRTPTLWAVAVMLGRWTAVTITVRMANGGSKSTVVLH